MVGRVDGKVAFITGAARGQGRSHAVRLAEEGADIIGVDVLGEIPGAPYIGATEEDLAETVAQVEALGRRMVARRADVRDFESLEAAVDDGVSELGRMDIVCANAGISTAFAPAHELTEEIWVDMIDVNLNGVWRTCKAAIPHLKSAGGGSIIITNSGAGLFGFENIAHYVAAKHGLVGLMRTLALELAPDMIRVNSIHPTNVDTPMIHNEELYRLFRPDLPDPGVEDFKVAAASMNALPIPWVDPIDISNGVLWLASDDARYVTGMPFPIDAGTALK